MGPADQQRPDGSDSYNPGDADWSRKVGRDLSNLETVASPDEEAAVRRARARGGSLSDTDSLRQKEEESQISPLMPNAHLMSTGEKSDNRNLNRGIMQRLFSRRGLNRKTSTAALLLVLFGGGGFLTVFLSPTLLGAVNFKEVLSKGLNDQFHALDSRSSTLLRAKMKDVTKGSCGAVKIRCRFATISDAQAEKFKSSGIEMELDHSVGLGSKRGQIQSMKFTDSNGKTLEITKASELQDALLHSDNLEFRAAMLKGYNPFFAGFTDRVALSVMRSLKVSKHLVATGDSDEERQKKVDEAVSGIEDPNAKTITTKKDEQGNEHYYDSEGNELTSDQVNGAEQSSGRIAEYIKSGGMKTVLNSAVKGVSIVGYMDSACTVFNSLRVVSAMSKVIKLAQAARFSMAMVLNPGDSEKAGAIKMEDATFVNNNLTATQPPGQVLDESKLNQPGSASKPATTQDPEAGYNAYDSPGYHIAAYGDAPTLSLRASRFMLGGGSTALLDGVLSGIARVVNVGDSNPQAVSQKCRYIQNPAVRFTGLAIGIIAGIGSFGLTTAAGIAGSVAVAESLPYLESEAADLVAGNLFKGLSGVDSGDAAYVGAAGMFGTMAMNSGEKPLSKKNGMKILAANQQAYDSYAATEQYIARATPFDINNQFSFMGSLARSFVPTLEHSKASVSSALVNVASIIPMSLNSLVKPAKALSSEYFDKCNDPAYKSIGIDGGPFCEVRYGLDENELAMDPLDNVQWMADTGNIDPTSDSGNAKDNGQQWNYVKFLDQCAHRKYGWGEDQGENEGDGSDCIDPAKEEMNKHFRVYTMDQRVDASLDGSNQNIPTPSDDGFTDGQSGTVNADGWAFPTVTADTITKNYEPSATPPHMGINIAGKSDLETRGQPIFAAYEGDVVAAGPNQDLGNWIVIEHKMNGQVMSTVYGHMDDNGITVHPGQHVTAGQEIGHIGSKGTPDGKPYLYFELWQGQTFASGNRIDPTPYVQAAQKKTGASGA